MSLNGFFAPGRLGLSYELFPPKTARGEENLLEQVDQLLQFAPDFITCTYGAGGSTRQKTLAILERVRQLAGLPVASHLTVVGSTVDELRAYLAEAAGQGVDYIVALRGDPPAGAESFVAVEGGLRYANELVELVRREYPQFGVLVAGYPETHREAPSPAADLANLRRKVDAGADAIVTQLFYNNDDFFRFVERCRGAGIGVPIVPGILPVTSLQQIQRITALCGAKLPAGFVSRLGERPEPEWQFEAGVEWATRQCEELIAQGVPAIHFYVLNQSPATIRILTNLNAAALRGA
jgi:methylenetetrahydrofolate reductase (NADPH)